MKILRAVSLSILLTTTASTSFAISAPCHEEVTPTSLVQPGRLETAAQIKSEADAFVIKAKVLHEKLSAQIAQTENQIAQTERLIAQATSPATSAEPPAATSTAPASSSTSSSSTSSATSETPSATATPASSSAPAKPGDAAAAPEKLSGRASQLQTVPTPNIPLIKLKGLQLQQAQKQFGDDVKNFKVHAAEYNKNLNLFRSQIGECHAAQETFQGLHKKYEMHCNQYHMENIPPPHLCIDLTVSAAEASSMANQLMNDQMRALRAEAQLKLEETRLAQLENTTAAADKMVVKESDRARREKQLAGMFGRLRQEYELLEIERKTIDHSKSASAGKPVARPYVSGKIKRK
ncbi:MAG: hypothetical protein IAF58_06590 [Leptolyngbya sp.]|nr:hypothetical protein [Candidatus Melainabacteria bacterium]